MNMNLSTCPHCGQTIKAEGIPIHVLLSEVGLRHTVLGTTLDFKAMKAWKSRADVNLTITMWRILAVMIATGGDIISRDDVVNIVWGHGSLNHRSIDTFVSVIRNKIGNVIKCHNRIGYQWCPEGFSTNDRRTNHLRSPHA